VLPTEKRLVVSF